METTMRKLLTLWIALAAIVGISTSSFAQGGMMPGPGTPASSGGGRTCTDDTASTNFLGRTSGLSNTEKDAYCNMIKGLEADSIITGNLSGATGCGSKLDGLYIFATNTTTTANLNLCGTSFGLTSHGTITFNADTGYTGNGPTGYLDTGFNLSTAGGNLSLNSASLGTYILTNRTTNSAAVPIGAVSSSNYVIIQPLTGGVYTWEINAVSFPSVANSSTKAAWVSTRTGASAEASYKNGSSTAIATGSVTSVGLPNASLAILALNSSGTIVDFDSDQTAATFFGGALTGTQAAAVNNRINTYLCSFSQNVYTPC
jgi:hypothetical protein